MPPGFQRRLSGSCMEVLCTGNKKVKDGCELKRYICRANGQCNEQS